MAGLAACVMWFVSSVIAILVHVTSESVTFWPPARASRRSSLLRSHCVPRGA